MNRQPRFRADRLKEEVDRLSVKPGKLAEELGVSYETLYKTLRGEIAQPSAETLAKIAIKTGRSIEYFMDLTDDKTPVDLGLTEMQYSIIQLLKTLPNSRQRDVLLMAKTYAETREETTREFFRDVRDMLFRTASESGRNQELEHYLEERLKALENGDAKEDSPSKSEDTEDDDTEGSQQPAEE